MLNLLIKIFGVYLSCVYIDSLTSQGAKERRMQSSDTE